jgi:hypothetical protein
MGSVRDPSFCAALSRLLIPEPIWVILWTCHICILKYLLFSLKEEIERCIDRLELGQGSCGLGSNASFAKSGEVE